MSRLSEHLQKHLDGEVLATSAARQYFSTDGSIFTIPPRVVVYPRHATDMRKLVRFSWQLAEQGKHLPITARGKGTDQSGAALGDGMMLVLPAHMNKTLGFDKTDITVQPGLLYGDLQRTLHSHGRFMPPYPSSIDFSTIGGAIANNACGEKSLKYGCTRDYVKSLEVVLANGQLITARPLSAKELSLKKGQTDFEGEIYRQLDGLLLDNEALINKMSPEVSKNAAGYPLWEVRGKSGVFDLSKLFVGSQGTLGVVTEATLATAPYNPHTHLLVTYFDDFADAEAAILKLRRLDPSTIEAVDYHLLEALQRHQPQRLAGIISGELPKLLLLVEFDDEKQRTRVTKVKQANKALHGLARQVYLSTNPTEQASLWDIRRSAAAGMWHSESHKQAIPVIEDGIVPINQLAKFLDRLYDLFAKHHLEIEVSGHGGDANFHIKPLLDLREVGDRQMVFKLMNEFYDMVIEMGGSTTAEHNDGRLRAPYLKQLYGQETYDLFQQVKHIFDPYNILNPGVKLNVALDDLKPLVRSEYSLKHLYDHMPQAT